MAIEKMVIEAKGSRYAPEVFIVFAGWALFWKSGPDFIVLIAYLIKSSQRKMVSHGCSYPLRCDEYGS